IAEAISKHNVAAGNVREGNSSCEKSAHINIRGRIHRSERFAVTIAWCGGGDRTLCQESTVARVLFQNELGPRKGGNPGFSRSVDAEPQGWRIGSNPEQLA